MRRLFHEVFESFRIASQQIAANRLRSFLTALGVIIGIVAITLMGTAIGGIDRGVDRSLAVIGDDVVYVQKWPWRDVEDWWNYRNRPGIRTRYAAEINDYIAEQPGTALMLAVPADSFWPATVTHGETSVREIFCLGITSDLTRISRTDMLDGRFFNELESRSGRNIAVIGFDVAEALFPGRSAVGERIRVGDNTYTVLGVIDRQGSFLGLWSWDSMIALPLSTFQRQFQSGQDAEIRVQIDKARLAEGKEELRGLMRRIRGLQPEERDDFEINEQQAIRNTLDPIKSGIATAGLGITGLALFVGAIGIMNITYVSVKERTREIGTRKALGARRRTILLQFLIEAVAICLVGGLTGILLTWVLLKAVAAGMPNLPLVLTPSLVVFALATSVVVGVVSGFAPAVAASRLDPVEALRYE